MTLRIVCISDTHNLHDRLVMPPGDVLVHAGDITGRGAPEDVERFDAWLGTLPYRHRLVIAGNHDFLFEREPVRARRLITNALYLEDAGVEIEGVRFWGSPWQPWFLDWAFNLARGPEIAKKWALIPRGTDVLVTHGPPLGIGDLVDRGERVGCGDLLEAVHRIRPALHIFGHIHEGYGITRDEHTQYVNASSCDVRYRPVNPPLVVEVAPRDEAAEESTVRRDSATPGPRRA